MENNNCGNPSCSFGHYVNDIFQNNCKILYVRDFNVCKEYRPEERD